MVTGMGRSLRMRRSRSAEIMVFSSLKRSEVNQVGLLLPVGLQEDAVDVVDVNRFVGAADGLDHAADAEVAGLAQDAVGAADDEIDGGAGEGVVSESDAVEFAEDEVAHVVGIEPLGDDGVGDAALDVVVDAEVEAARRLGRPTRTRLWFLGKSSKRSRSL